MNQRTEPDHSPSSIAPPASPVVPASSGGAIVPSPAPVPARVRGKGRRRLALALAAIVLMAGAGGIYWWQHVRNQLPAGIVSGNGRLEADEIDIDTKFAGRVSELLAQEGDMVQAGQVVARMDVKELEATLKRGEAQAEQAAKAIEEGRALLEQLRTELELAKQQWDRTNALAQSGNATRELLDQRRQQLQGATAAFEAALARVAQAELALAAAQHSVEITRINIADNTLVAPREGRIQYRIAQLGEVLPAGGKVYTMIDIASVYMDIFLPTLEAGRIAVGADSRIVVDAYPNLAIPAKVSFIATQSQFTPKPVETQTERDRLMFRVRVRIDPDLLRAHADAVRSGLPGIAYVRADPTTPWPQRLQSSISK